MCTAFPFNADLPDDNFFYLMIAVSNVKDGVQAKAEAAVLAKLPPRAAKGPKILPKLAGKLAAKAVAPEKVMVGVAGTMGEELPGKLRDEVGLSLTMETQFVAGPLVVIQVTATDLELEKLVETIGVKNARVGQVSGWMLIAADWLGLKDVLAEKMRRLTMEKVMGKLEEMIPRQLNERAGFEAEVACLLPADFPKAFLAMAGLLGVNGLSRLGGHMAPLRSTW